MKKLKGKLNISKMHNTDENDKDAVRITFIDDTSGCEAAEVRMSLYGFAEALFARGHVECDLIFNDSGVIGMKHEHKSEVVRKPKALQDLYKDDETTRKKLRKIVEKFEVEGWEARLDDLLNHHRRLKIYNDGAADYTVAFHRYVPVKGEEDGQT